MPSSRPARLYTEAVGTSDDRRELETAVSSRKAAPSAVLRVFWKGGSATHGLPDSPSVVVGRSAEADVAIDHASVSRKHARLHLGSRLLVEDLGSANHTTLAGRPLVRGVPTPVPFGEPFELGDVLAVVCQIPAEDTDPMAALEETAAKVAASDVSVLIVGETGSGKEVLAEKIHARSRRASGPFVRINCAALPDTLLESELFGHERGAFTGADRAKPGLLEQAHGGTFLLDEVGEMPLATQAKLLRVLESREIIRVGAVQPRAVDVRFVAATHRDLDGLVERGRFREDVLFRLKGFCIRVPPLRERVAEIAGLARLFAAQACERAQRAPIPITEDAITLLRSYRWPGNVRELRAVVERAVLLAAEVIDVEHLDFARLGPAEPRGADARPSEVPPPGGSVAPPPPAQGEGERERILQALEKCAGNQTRAAKLLGMTRRMLVYRLDALGVARPRRNDGD